MNIKDAMVTVKEEEIDVLDYKDNVIQTYWRICVNLKPPRKNLHLRATNRWRYRTLLFIDKEHEAIIFKNK